MNRFISLLTIVTLIVLLSGCSQDYKSQFLGDWEAKQASQQEGSNEILGHYNYLNVSSSNIILSTFHNEVEVDSGKTIKVFDNSDKNLTYEWKSKDQIIVDNKLYEIEVKKKELVIKNNAIEIHYLKEK